MLHDTLRLLQALGRTRINLLFTQLLRLSVWKHRKKYIQLQLLLVLNIDFQQIFVGKWIAVLQFFVEETLLQIQSLVERLDFGPERLEARLEQVGGR